MKFQVNGTKLNEVLGTVIKGFNAKEDNSYVAFKLNEDEKELLITSRSRSTYLEGTVKVHSVQIQDDEPRIYHLDGVKLKQLVSILPSAPVDISFEINNNTRSFTIKTLVSKYKLPVMSETPLASTPEVKEYATIDANDFMRVAKDLIKIVSTNKSHQEHQLSCMHFHLSDNKIKMIATDSMSLGTMEIDSNEIDLEEPLDILVRHTEVSTLLETFPPGSTLTVVGSDDMFGYVDENGTLSLVGIINLDAFDISQVGSRTLDDNYVVLEKNELKTALETVAKLSPHDTTVEIKISDELEEVRVSNKYGDYIDVELSDSSVTSPGTAAFMVDIILKSINPANNGPLRLEFSKLSDDSEGAAATRVVSLLADGSDDKTTSLLAIQQVRE